jgi:NCAIR mutase (PurE)-related protein
MDESKLRHLLQQVQKGEVAIEEALDRLRNLPYEDLGYARLDYHRGLRQGMPEVVFCQSKTVSQAVEIISRLAQQHDRVLASRASAEVARAVQEVLPHARYHAAARLLTVAQHPPPPLPEDAPYILVVTGGTADLPVAEEAALSAEFFGSRVERAYDVGVAGLHRLLDQRELLFKANAVIAVAGMEGALASVVGGLVSCPVVAVPTSVGYGASFGGLAALLAMLNSCAPGVAVVNIDNGFGAGVYAHMINQRNMAK